MATRVLFGKNNTGLELLLLFLLKSDPVFLKIKQDKLHKSMEKIKINADSISDNGYFL